MPSFYIATPDATTGLTSFNDATMFDFSFQEVIPDLTAPEGFITKTIDALPCKDVVPKYVTNEITAKAILLEFGELTEEFLCPDTPSYTLYIEQWQVQGTSGYQNFLI